MTPRPIISDSVNILNTFWPKRLYFVSYFVHAFGRNVHVFSGQNGSWPKCPVTEYIICMTCQWLSGRSGMTTHGHELPYCTDKFQTNKSHYTSYLTKYWQLCFTHVLRSQISVTWYVGEQRSDWVIESELWLTVTVSDTDSATDRVWLSLSSTVTARFRERQQPWKGHIICAYVCSIYQSSLLMYCLLLALFQALLLLWTNETGVHPRPCCF